MESLKENDFKIKTSNFTYITTSKKSENGLLINNALSRKSIELDLLIIRLLEFLNNYRTKNEILEFCKNDLNISKDNSEEIINYLLENRYLTREGDLMENRSNHWISCNWGSSLLYHQSTYDHPVLDYSTAEAYTRDQEAMKEYKETSNEPSIYKTFDDYIEEIKLPSPLNVDVPYEEVLVNGSNLHEEVNIDKLSTILFYTYGEISNIKFPVTQRLLRRTSPSGGARHPSECYLAIFDVEGLKPGLYHYSVKNHSLVLLKNKQLKSFCIEHCYGLRDYNNPRIVFFHTSIFERNWWRYREPKTYKVIYYDFGHILFNFRLITTALSLSTYTIGSGVNDSEIENLLNINGYKEGILYFTAI
ncbi:SagB/ThcOx family dehydrogenase [Metabacillus indicus]|uniref:SagB/ThcOx family dehydrogenase n=1 Tax=Metabacillus indicus TaxID=246786 RepID=UPI002A05678D|nr:SagB/ThcOx family dehydrogenase [Metabacillus indicus]MDX8288698.1 SagB/ThcOx family dehydrogenase [Metabacillus indicus]